MITRSLSYLLTMVLGVVLSFNLSAQPWLRGTSGEPTPNFYQMKAAANERLQRVQNEKGKGFKAMKRWENYWEPRVLPDGSFPAADQTQQAWNSYLQQNQLAPAIPGASWTSLGPNSSAGGYAGIGRINRIAFHPTNSNTIFACTAGGGLWKTTNGGTSWSPLTDNLSSIGTSGLVIHPTTPDIMYLATGDADGYDTYSYGVLKTTDGGTSWSTTGLTFSPGSVIYSLVMHPDDPNTLLAATSQGVYRTTDAGAAWTKTLNGTYYDLEFKPGTASTIYVSSYNGIYRSTDTGVNWTQTLSISGVERIAIAVSPANTEFVGALIANNSNYGFLAFYASTNGGTSFSSRATSPNLLGWSTSGNDTGGQGWYDLCLAISPTDADQIFVGGVNTWKSTNGGTSWTVMTHWNSSGGSIPTMHADHHDLVFQNSTTMYSANDGGIYRSTNSGTSWTDISNSLVISQMYRIGASQTDTRVIAGLQDNGTKLRSTGGTWTDELGGDGMECAIDPTNASYMYGTYYYGELRRSSNGGTSWVDITPNSTPAGNWVTPFVIDPNTPSTLYIGYGVLYKSTNRGDNWTNISGTTTGSSKINSIAVAPSNSNTIYINWSNKIAITTNGGTSWSTYNLPLSNLTSMAVDPTDANVVFATFSNFTSGSKVYKSIDGGATWTNISGTLPNVPANKIIYQNGSNGALYLGMDAGIYYRDNSMTDWALYNTNLPNVEIYDLEIRYSDNKLIAGTYGRGLWESPLYVASTAPTITSFTPTSAIQGASVTITGTNFTGATAVSFGGTAAASFTVNSATQITAVVGTGASGSVSVTTPEGTATKTGFTFQLVPTITSFTPTSGGQGASVTITGTNFTGATAVSFGGTVATSFTVNSATQITAVLGVGASGNVAVTTPGGTATKSGFTYLAATPTITSFTPTSATQGATVIITGTAFSGATAVSFGGTAASSFTVNSATQITAVVGAGTSGSVSVTTPGGTATLAGFTYIQPGTLPTISSFSPTSQKTGSAVIIYGTNFTGTTSVTFGGTPALSFTVVSATQITAVVGAGSSGAVQVTTPDGSASRTGFTYQTTPVITSFTPTSAGPGMTVTITGANLGTATSVKFGGRNAASFIKVNATTITAVVGTGLSGTVSVATSSGTASLSGFTYVNKPSITSFTPTSGIIGAKVTIYGSNLSNATAVTFGGVAASSFVVNSSSRITAYVGAGASGEVAVTTPGGTAAKTGFNFTGSIAAPTVASFTPTSAASAASVVITGTGFTGATAVSFGGTPAASYTVNNATQITAVVGAGASGSVSVTNSGGTGSKTGFTFIASANTPTIASFSPESGEIGTSVVLTGTNFTGATAVSFGGVAATSFTVNSSTQITAVVGAGASGNVSVTTPEGTGTRAGFTFIGGGSPPTVASFTPTSQKTGSSVTITGTNFTNATGVTFGGTPALSFTVVSATQITAVVGIGSTGAVQVTTPAGSASKTGFTYQTTPVITSFTPTSAGPGMTVTITGANLGTATSVKFGGRNAASFIKVNATTITAVVGTGLSGTVSVATSSGTASLSGFTYVNKPSITSFTPTSGIVGAKVTIYGSNLSNATAVTFGGVAASSFVVNSSSRITAYVGAGASGTVTVTTPGGIVSKAGFTFTGVIIPPAITAFNPTSATTGTSVVITGTDFTGATAVSFGGTPAASYVVNSATQITAVVGAGASGSVSVTAPTGTGSTAGFTFISPANLPTITSFSPEAGANGTSVVLTGTSFTGATAVSFGGVPASSFTVNSATQITAVVGAGASGNVSVTTPEGTGTKAGFIYSTSTAPLLTSFTPGTAESGTSVVISGINFIGATAVSFGGTPAASFTVNSATQITAVVGTGASGDVSVTTPEGTGTKAGFTFLNGGTKPSITGFTPALGFTGATITITGVNFTGATSVTMGGVPATNVVVVNATTITARVALGNTGDITVTTPEGTATKSGFTYRANTPTSVVASDGTFSDKVRITWSGTTGLYFRVFRNTTTDTYSAIPLGNWQTTREFEDVTAKPGTTYYYWVKAALQPTQDTFWREDFSDLSKLSTTWAQGGTNAGSEVWRWSTNTDPLFLTQPAFGAKTASNGHLVFNSDDNGEAAHDVFIQTGPINCSGKKNLYVRFENQYGYFSFPPTSNPQIGVSTDGVNFSYYSVLQSVPRNDLSQSVQIEEVPIPMIQDHPTVYLRFRWQGFWEYVWRIDDITVASGTTEGLFSAYNTGYRSGSSTTTPGDSPRISPLSGRSKNGLSQQPTLAEATPQPEVRVYPNPVNDLLFIQHPAAYETRKVEVFSSIGQRMIQTTLSMGSALDVSKLLPGVYLLVVDPEGERSLIRFVKQ